MFLIAGFCDEGKENENTREPVEDVAGPGGPVVEVPRSEPNYHEIDEFSHPVEAHDDEQLKADLHVVAFDVEVPVACPDSPEESVDKESVEDNVEGEKDNYDEVKIEKGWFLLL